MMTNDSFDLVHAGAEVGRALRLEVVRTDGPYPLGIIDFPLFPSGSARVYYGAAACETGYAEYAAAGETGELMWSSVEDHGQVNDGHLIPTLLWKQTGKRAA